MFKCQLSCMACILVNLHLYVYEILFRPTEEKAKLMKLKMAEKKKNADFRSKVKNRFGVTVKQILSRASDLSQLGFECFSAKFPHSPILHYACGSMYVVLCFTTKKQQKRRIVP